MYSLTTAGNLFLKNWLAILDTHKAMVETLIERGASPTSTGKPDAKQA
jgi:hypothetical protein